MLGEAMVVEVPLRWSDIDAQGHVNNAVFLEFLQEARVSLLQAGPAAAMLTDGVVVTQHRVEYLRPILLSPTPLEVRIGVCEVGAARFAFAYEIWHDGALCARARTSCCPFDLASQQPRRLSDTELAQLAEHRVEEEPWRELDVPPLDGFGEPVPLRVRWSDQDSFGHVNNVVYYDYFQEARIRLMAEANHGVPTVGPGAGHVWFVVRQDVDYVAQVHHREEPWVVRNAVVAVGNTSLTLAAELCDGDGPDAPVHARSRTVLVHADLQGQPQPVPAETLAALSAWRLPRP